MFHDMVAMKGFGKMFQKFWQDQLDNSNTLRKYVLIRGGLGQAPFYNVGKFFLVIKKSKKTLDKNIKDNTNSLNITPSENDDAECA